MTDYYIDWLIVGGFLFFLTFIAHLTGKYNKNVTDFLAANRCAGRYLITISDSIAGLGAISIIAFFQLYYNAGFSAVWWKTLEMAAVSFMMLTGWVVYRFRRTKALTMAQFLEIRYSRKFRMFAGLLAWFSGVVNFGIFPAVGANFFMHFFGIPERFIFLGISFSSFVVIIFILLSISLFFVFKGGLITVIVTDFFQGAFCNIAFIVISLYLLYRFGWSTISETLASFDEQKSLIYPFKTQAAEDFNIVFYLMTACLVFYTSYAWQGNQGYNCSALTPHEARMGKILGTWRLFAMTIFVLLLPIVAYIVANNPQYASISSGAFEEINRIENPQLQSQMTTPIILKHILPSGLIGLMGALMVAAFISTHDTYMHSWGSIFVQDVILPFKKKPFSPKGHILALRGSIVFVALFIFLFSILFRQTDYIIMYFYISGAIFTGGAGSVIVGGLYWKRGTTAAAWTAMLIGSILAVSFIVLQQLHSFYPFEDGTIIFKLATTNGVVLSFSASTIAIVSYIVVSLVVRRPDYNMDKMLHRGKYELPEELLFEQKSFRKVGVFSKLIGITDEFNLKDKLIYLATLGWTVLWMSIFAIGTIYHIFFEISDNKWQLLWKYYLYYGVAASAITGIWFTVCGAFDLSKMLKLLKVVVHDDSDDGTVTKEK